MASVRGRLELPERIFIVCAVQSLLARSAHARPEFLATDAAAGSAALDVERILIGHPDGGRVGQSVLGVISRTLPVILGGRLQIDQHLHADHRAVSLGGVGIFRVLAGLALGRGDEAAEIAAAMFDVHGGRAVADTPFTGGIGKSGSRKTDQSSEAGHSGDWRKFHRVFSVWQKCPCYSECLACRETAAEI